MEASLRNAEALVGVTVNLLGELHPAFTILREMVAIYDDIKFARGRCKAVIKRAAFIIRDIHHMTENRHSTLSNLSNLEKNLRNVQVTMKRLAGLSFFKALLRFDEINLQIEEAHHHLSDCLRLFQIGLFMDHVQKEKKKAEELDSERLKHVLREVAGNYPKICDHLDLHTEEEEDLAMVAMEKKLSHTETASKDAVEMQVLKKSLECIKMTTGRNAPNRKEWLITKYDLEDLGTIGGGGFSTVSKARYRGLIVAVKTLKDFVHTKEVLESEVEIWSKLRHDHIVPFYGASTLTRPPYIISRYMANGNLIQYLANKSGVDRTKMVFEVSLGMFYLHEEQVIHGDLKGVNVLVDDSGKACITDFGLSTVSSSRKINAGMGEMSGTLRFLAPEALKGKPLTFETDVYAFGMLIYEVFVGEVPFIRESDDRVRQGTLKLHRPTSSKACVHGFNDALWKLLSECITRKPSARPHFQAIQERLRLLNKPEPRPNPDIYKSNWLSHVPPTRQLPTLRNSIPPLPKDGKLVWEEQPSVSSHLSTTQKITSVAPICIEVTLKRFGVRFGVSPEEPGAHFEEHNTLQWQSIRPGRYTVLRSLHGQFECYSRINGGRRTWTLDRNNVIVQSSSGNHAVHRFNDAKFAAEWFGLQLRFATNGMLPEWGNSGLTGDWFQTTQNWRRVKRGWVQKADLVKGPINLVPPGRAWMDVNLPKHWAIDESLGTTNCVVCVTNAGTSLPPGKFTCTVEGRKIVFETYRRQHDARPIKAVEELYPSESDAGTMFQVLTAILTKEKKKHISLHFPFFQAFRRDSQPERLFLER